MTKDNKDNTEEINWNDELLSPDGLEEKKVNESHNKETPEKKKKVLNMDKAGTPNPKHTLKKELIFLKESSKSLKKFGMDWILKWTKTKNFLCWEKMHSKSIGERSINNPHAKDHFWFYENGDIYYGNLIYGLRFDFFNYYKW